MTTARKVMLIVATVFLVGGSALAMGAFALADFRFENLSNDTRDWTSTTMALDPEAEAPHATIVVHDSAEGVRFEATDGDAIEVTYWTSSEKSIEVTDEEGILEVTGTATSLSTFEFMKVEFQDHATVIKVPRSYAGSITAETASGSVTVYDLEGTGAVTAASSSGSVEMANLKDTGAILAQSSSGRVALTSLQNVESAVAQPQSGDAGISDVNARTSVELRSTSGSVWGDVVRAGSFYASSTSGEVSLSFIEADSVEARDQSGSIYADYLDAADVALSTTSGDVAVNDLLADVVALDSASGSIRAAVVGDPGSYVVEANATSGSVNVPRGADSSDKRIGLRTASGDIDLAFSAASDLTWPESSMERAAKPSGSTASAAPAAPAAPEAPAAP